MKFFKKTFGGSRVTESNPLFSSSTTKNILKLNKPAAALIKVDYGQMEDKEKGLFLMMGEVEVEGKVTRVVTLVTPNAEGEVDSSAAKLGNANGNSGGAVSCSNSEMYYEMGGKPGFNRHFSITGVLVPNADGTGLVAGNPEDISYGDTAFWTYEFKEEKKGITRGEATDKAPAAKAKEVAAAVVNTQAATANAAAAAAPAAPAPQGAIDGGADVATNAEGGTAAGEEVEDTDPLFT